VVFTSKNSFDALVDHLRADWVLGLIFRWLKVGVLLWHDKHGFVVLHFFGFACLHDGALDVGPNIRCIVPIEVNDLFMVLALIWRITLKGNGIQIILVSFIPDDIDSLMHSDLWMLVAVLYLITGQNPIVADLLELDLRGRSDTFLEAGHFGHLLLVRRSLSEISAQSRFAHSWEADWNKEKLCDVLHFWVLK
jgi:hypothetical protein